MPNNSETAAACWAVAMPMLAAHLERQRAFSLRTFGPGERTAGVCNHMRKELAEITADPDDVVEYADMVILAFDGAMRAGHAPRDLAIAFLRQLEWPGHRSEIYWIGKAIEAAEKTPAVLAMWANVAVVACEVAAERGLARHAVVAAVIAKQARNEARTWPDWRTLPPDAPIEHVSDAPAGAPLKW